MQGRAKSGELRRLEIRVRRILQKGSAYCEAGELAQGIQVFTEALALNHKESRPEILASRCMAYALCKMCEPAIEDADTVLSLDPSSVTARFWKALALSGLGRELEARKCVAAGLELAPENPELTGLLKKNPLVYGPKAEAVQFHAKVPSQKYLIDHPRFPPEMKGFGRPSSLIVFPISGCRFNDRQLPENPPPPEVATVFFTNEMNRHKEMQALQKEPSWLDEGLLNFLRSALAAPNDTAASDMAVAWLNEIGTGCAADAGRTAEAFTAVALWALAPASGQALYKFLPTFLDTAIKGIPPEDPSACIALISVLSNVALSSRNGVLPLNEERSTFLLSVLEACLEKHGKVDVVINFLWLFPTSALATAVTFTKLFPGILKELLAFVKPEIKPDLACRAAFVCTLLVNDFPADQVDHALVGEILDAILHNLRCPPLLVYFWATFFQNYLQHQSVENQNWKLVGSNILKFYPSFFHDPELQSEICGCILHALEFSTSNRLVVPKHLIINLADIIQDVLLEIDPDSIALPTRFAGLIGTICVLNKHYGIPVDFLPIAAQCALLMGFIPSEILRPLLPYVHLVFSRCPPKPLPDLMPQFRLPYRESLRALRAVDAKVSQALRVYLVEFSRSCEYCGTPEKEGHPLRACSACRVILYCSTECQKKDWNQGGHKSLCQKDKN